MKSQIFYEKNFQIKPDEEYPEWLWTLNTGPPKTLDELDPETKEYWKKLRKINLRRNNTLSKLRKF
jgi:large subunit ribosomal protein L54